MDTSKFSLRATAEIIKPHLEHLSFKRLKDYSSFRTDYVGGPRYGLTFWEGRTVAPISISLDDRVHMIPVNRRVTLHHSGARARKITYDELFAMRSDIGGRHLEWLARRAVFGPANQTTHFSFYLEYAEIFEARDESLTAHLDVPTDFPTRFWTAIMSWVNESKEARRKALDSLQVLNETCRAQIVKPVLDKDPAKVTT
ncbi:hypothetical protein KGQ31_02610 [Patescibacteria group bacterium]|nr:hypothetical protein [Patescibacteria group bacterium]